MKLKTEMEVLTITRENFRNKLGCCDSEMTYFITIKATSKLVKKGLKFRLEKTPKLKKLGKRISKAKRRLFRKIKAKLEI